MAMRRTEKTRGKQVLAAACAALSLLAGWDVDAATTVLCADTTGTSPCPLPGSSNPAGDLIQIATANTVENLTTYFNSGAIEVASGATFDNQFVSFPSNFGFIRTNESGSFLNAGTIHNEAFFQIEDDATLAIQTGTTFDNDFGDLSIYDDGVVTNDGEIDNTGYIYLLIDDSNDPPGDPDDPTLHNNGSLMNQDFSLVLNDGDFNNNGTVNNAATAEFYTSRLLNNTGTFVNDGLVDNTEFDGVGGQIRNSGTFEVSASGTVDGGTAVDPRGDYRQTAGSTQVDGTMWQRNIDIEAGTLTGIGDLKGSVTIGDDTGATASLEPGNPGDATATLEVAGSLDLSSDAELTIELASLLDFDRVVATGDATLGGKLTVRLVGGYEPQIGDSFVFLSAANVSDPFDTTSFPVFNGKTFDLTTDSTSARVGVIESAAVPALGPCGSAALMICLLITGIARRAMPSRSPQHQRDHHEATRTKRRLADP